MRIARSGPLATATCAALLSTALLGASCGEVEVGDGVEARASALSTDPVTNPSGAAQVVTVDGTPMDMTNPFFQNLGTTGRACVTCHQPSAAMTITPPQVQALFNATQCTDPLFRLNDGANGPNAPVTTLAQRQAAYSLVLSKGLIRIPLACGFR